MRRQSLALAERLLSRTELDDAGAGRPGLPADPGRPADAAEVRRASGYLAEYEAERAPRSAPRAVAIARGREPPRPRTTSRARKPAPANPDEADQSDEPVKEEVIRPADAADAAWASFCQALFGSAEFRYLR